MEIKKADSKGRVTVGEPGRAYEVITTERGTIELWPIYTKEEVGAVGQKYWLELHRRIKNLNQS